jgi:hypothetical protein
MRLGHGPLPGRPDAPLRLELTVEGRGDLELLPLLTPETGKQVSLFADRPRIDREFNGTAYRERWRRAFLLVADHDYTLPPLTLRVFNPRTGLVETLSTPSLTVKIPPPPFPPSRLAVWAVLFLAGLATGMGLLLLLHRLRHRKVRSPLSTHLLRRATERELYEMLLPYAGDAEVDEALKKLERNLYGKEQVKIDRKGIAETMERVIGENLEKSGKSRP